MYVDLKDDLLRQISSSHFFRLCLKTSCWLWSAKGRWFVFFTFISLRVLSRARITTFSCLCWSLSISSCSNYIDPAWPIATFYSTFGACSCELCTPWPSSTRRAWNTQHIWHWICFGNNLTLLCANCAWTTTCYSFLPFLFYAINLCFLSLQLLIYILDEIGAFVQKLLGTNLLAYLFNRGQNKRASLDFTVLGVKITQKQLKSIGHTLIINSNPCQREQFDPLYKYLWNGLLSKLKENFHVNLVEMNWGYQWYQVL